MDIGNIHINMQCNDCLPFAPCSQCAFSCNMANLCKASSQVYWVHYGKPEYVSSLGEEDLDD